VLPVNGDWQIPGTAINQYRASRPVTTGGAAPRLHFLWQRNVQKQ
jgi:hypothetical protein